MFIEVIKYEKVCGSNEIPLEFYVIAPEDEESEESILRKLLSEGVETCRMYSVELMSGQINYVSGEIKFPSLGIKKHISAIMKQDSFIKVLSSQFVFIDEYLA